MAKTLQLNDAWKHFTGDQDKTLPPAETVRRFKQKAAETGLDILAETRRIDTGRLGIPVFFSVCGSAAAALTGTRKQMGKGATEEQAEASAVMELAERFSFYRFSDRAHNFVVDARKNLGATAVSFAMLADSVQDDPDRAAAVRPFFDDLPLRWTRAVNLTTGASALIPLDWFFAINAFNGTSAGNCPEEAICQGLCEVVERHVSCLIARRRQPVPALDPRSAGHPAVTDLVTRYRAAGVRLTVFDFTLDTGIPTVGVLAYDPDTFPEKSELVWTAGTASDPEKALSRALTETAQLGGDFHTGSCYVESGLPKLSSLAAADFLLAPREMVRLADLPDLSHDNIKVEIERCLAALSGIGQEVWVVDMTDPVLGVPAFYTFIPGAAFFQRAENASAGMFTAKLAAEQLPPDEALSRLAAMDEPLDRPYFVSFYMGMCHLAQAEQQTALDYFHRARERRPPPQDFPSVCSYMGFCLKEMEQYRQALSVLEEGLEVDGDRTDILNLMGFCCFKLGEHERAIECFQQILRIDPGSAIDYANVASNYRDMGQTAKAVYYYQRALDLDPELDFARSNLERLAAGEQ